MGRRAAKNLLGTEGAQFCQRVAVIELFACHCDAVIHLTSQTGHYKSAGGIDDCHLTLCAFHRAGENAFEITGVFRGVAAAQCIERSGRDV